MYKTKILTMHENLAGHETLEIDKKFTAFAVYHFALWQKFSFQDASFHQTTQNNRWCLFNQNFTTSILLNAFWKKHKLDEFWLSTYIEQDAIER